MARSSGKGSWRVRDVCGVLSGIAPPALAAEWDNVGLLVGREAAPVRSLVLTIDLTEAVLREAVGARAEMVMAYHPPIFKPILRLTASSSPVAYAAARSGLALYSMHTALDAAEGGTNDALAGAMGMVDLRPLTESKGPGECKIVVFVPAGGLSAVAAAAFAAGAGRIGNYSECSFRTGGAGTFRGGAGSRPAVGRAGRREEVQELRLELVAPRAAVAEVVRAIRKVHRYETPAIDVYPLEGLPGPSGMGRIGSLRPAVSFQTLLRRVRRLSPSGRVLVAGPRPGRVRTVACCAGSCGDAFRSAVSAGAQVYVTGEMRHHDALAAASAGLTVVCVGHSNSERPVLLPLAARIRRELPGLKVLISRQDRDPFEII